MLSTDKDWVSKSTHQNNINLEIGFILASAFFIDDDPQTNQPSKFDNIIPVASPNFIKKEQNIALASEVLGNEKELAIYYKRLIDLASNYNKKYQQIYRYFCLRLEICNSNKSICIPFPKYSSLSDMKPFFIWLLSCNNNSSFSDFDLELGWEFNAICLKNKLHFRVSNSDDSIDKINISVDKDSFLFISKQQKAITDNIVNYLTKVLSVDLWTRNYKNDISLQNSINFILDTLNSAYQFLKNPFFKKALCILILLDCIATSLIIYHLKEKEMQQIQTTFENKIMIERAAVKNFESVKRFLKIAPDSFLVYNQYSEIVLGKEIYVYSCILPPFFTNKSGVIFKGQPIFEIKPLLRKNKQVRVTIEEMEASIEEARKK